VDVYRWSEARRLVGFEKRESPTRLVASRFDGHLKPAQVDGPTLARTKNNDFSYRVTHHDFSSWGQFSG
jgi:hypothetical protein